MNPDTWLVPAVGLALTLVVMFPFLRRQRRRDRVAKAAAQEAVLLGLDEPVSLHPVVNLERCIGTGSCVSVCPEGDVLALRDGVAHAIAPGRCIGHGLCERSCPVEAIQLVFGTAKRGVELPRIRQNFETNVPGLFIVGELGGMGLIRNAFEQGRQCIEGITAQSRKGKDGEMLDLIVVGCGPAGLSASLHAKHQGLKFRTFEREDIGGTVRHYPRKKLVMSAPLAVPGYGKLDAREIRKEDLMKVWTDIVRRTGLEVGTQEPVERIARAKGGFEITTPRGSYGAHRVVLAIGRRGKPRRLGVPGEDLPKVSYALHEPESFQGDRMLVVGGGDSAVEAALALAEQPGNEVTVSYRRERFTRLKPANRDRFEKAMAGGKVRALWSTNVKEIGPDRVVYADQAGAAHELANDYVLVFAGGELPTEFLKTCGVAIDTKFGTR
jgi:thioredoxin reductase/NAD-dependent dihydropyrimidine dehydrogenase PreA subunit